MTRLLLTLFVGWLLVGFSDSTEARDLKLKAIPHEPVEVRGAFWGSRLKTHHEVTIPHALDWLWSDVVSRKMYITGGVGTAQYHDEGFGDPYLLPNESAYCESCAAIAHVLWQHRVFLLKGHARYTDVMELTLYNGMLSGIAVSGDGFLYQNPPASDVCAEMEEGMTVKLVQKTDYPWNGKVLLKVTPEKPVEFTLCLRVPGWAQGSPVPSDLYRFGSPENPSIELKIQGEKVVLSPNHDGYLHLKRRWHAGDVVDLELPMPTRRVYAHQEIEADRGKVALMRGPIVYCVEAVDHPAVDLFRLSLPRKAGVRVEHRPQLLGGVTVLQAQATLDTKGAVRLTAVPYYAWANRERGAMTVWIKEALSKDQ